MNRLVRALVVVVLTAMSVNAQVITPVTVTVSTDPAPGHIYIAPNSRVPNPPYAPSLMVLDSAGVVVRSKVIPEYAFDFRPLPDGSWGYSVFQAAGSGARASSSIFVVDTNLNVVDSVRGGNRYNLAMHSFLVLPNGNRVVVMQEDVIVDMSSVVPGGHPAASVQQMILQELDHTGKVIFQWRALDHFPVTVTYEDMKAPSIRYFHLNAVEVDTDGHFLISARHASLVAKIHRTTGEVIWILGGKLNQFTFSSALGISDPPEFSYQHDIRRLPNGHISVFDNGTQRSPQWSRGVEYEIDEVNKTCTLVWQYRHTPDIYAGVQGSMQTLPNGHRLMAWGSALLDGRTLINEVNDSGRVVFEAQLPSMMFPYKAEKHPYPTGRVIDTVLIDEILKGNTYTYTNQSDTVGLKVTYHTLESFFYNTTTAKRYATSPLRPLFAEGEGSATQAVLAPSYVAPVRVTLTQEGMLTHAGEFRFHAPTIGLVRPERLIVYRRDTIGSGPFRELRTRFNPATQELVVDTTQAGEFCFGVPRMDPPITLQTPRQIRPIGGKRVLVGAPVIMQSSGQGLTSTYRNEVYRTIDGQEQVFHDRTVASDKDTAAALVNEGTYYWRTSAGMNVGLPAFAPSSSRVDSFVVTGPFVEMRKPDAGVVWTHDSSYAVTWESNIPGAATLTLVKGDQTYVIADSVRASSGGFLWKVPVSIPPGVGYAVRVRSRTGNPIVAEAITEPVVEIKEIIVSVDEDSREDLLLNVMPNPASTSLFVSATTPIYRYEIYSVAGERVLVHTANGTGERLDVSALTPGAYILVATGAGTTYTRQIVIRN